MLYTSVERMIAVLAESNFFQEEPDVAVVKAQFQQVADDIRKDLSQGKASSIYFSAIYDEDGELVYKEVDCVVNGVALVPTGEVVFMTPLGPIMLVGD